MENLVGHTREVGHLLDHLKRMEKGTGHHTVIESPPGMGRTTLLDRLAEEAESRGMRVLSGRGTRLDRCVQWSTLMRLFQHPLGQGISFLTDHGTGHVFDLALRMGNRLTEYASRQPVLVTLDDAHWSDEMTALLLPMLVEHTRELPILWLIGCGPLRNGGPVSQALELLTEEQGHLLRLGPLLDEEVTSLYQETVGEPPRGHLRLLEKCRGVPSLVVWMVNALRESRSTDPTRLCEVADLPDAFHHQVVSRLDKLDPRINLVLQVNAVLDRPFTLHEAARLLDSTPTNLLPVIDEALANDILKAREGRLESTDDLTRESVYLTMSPHTRHAFHREAAAMLEERPSGTRAEIIRHLVVCSESDRELTDNLCHAIESGDMSADMLAETTHLLLASGRTARARSVVLAVLERISYPSLLYTALAGFQETSSQHSSFVDVSPHVERALRTVEPGSEARAGLLAIRAGCLLEQGRPDQALDSVEEAVTLGLATRQTTAIVSAEVVRLRIAFGRGDLDFARDHAGEVLQRIPGSATATKAHRTTRLILAVALASQDRFVEASSTIDMALWEEVAADASAAPFWEAHRALLLLWRGELDRAEQACLRVDCGVDPSGNLARDVRSVLGHIHLLRGEEHVARQYFHRILAEDRSLSCPRQQEATLGLARATGGLPAAEIYGSLEGNATLLLRSPESAAHLVRLALKANRPEQAERVVHTSTRLARENPGTASLLGAARHASGLFMNDPGLLQAAVEAYEDSPRPFPRALALEDAGRAAARKGDTARSRPRLSRAHEIYEGCGARGPADRVARALRDLTRRSEGTPAAATPAPDRAWNELSDSERRVALLVTDGLTNREVADRIFLSPHTVDSHLRSSFRKLEVRNRVELARLMISRIS
ncbi:LuxR family transcriptional regulator [Nocardiopsis sp. JB363]|uniref:helix-turn-helix transcriptional regulator n=1 Tax=Nocardiopsis sp. JB363 TaxID=1434837 RepID=UPI000979E7D2|nr:LuxR family transcriptional regulator [Nocardiopsis sp. JB363]SIO88809.1 Transcriptional activator [Nocardiopsis sp. JB363]